MMLKRWLQRSYVAGLCMALVVPSLSFALGDAATIKSYVDRQLPVPLIKTSWGNFILHTESLNSLYSLRNYEAIWVDGNGLPNARSQLLQSVLKSAYRHGLSESDYWDSEIENLQKATLRNQKNWVTFELAASEALIRYATHLSTGRFDPEKIDTDIKYKRKEFTEFTELNAAIDSGEAGFVATLDSLAPSQERYIDLMDMLENLKDLKAQGGWPVLKSPGIVLKLGVSNPIIGQLRGRLNQMGYTVSLKGGNTFDAEFEKVLKEFQSMNGLAADGIIGTRSEVLRSLNINVQQRISQVVVNMEKLRWLPKNIESRHVFVNLATTEFYLFENGRQEKFFKTINGDPFHRTPSMRDQITYVNLNPYWTVPRSIAIKETLIELQQDSGYLQKHHMIVLNERTGRVMDSFDLNWKWVDQSDFPYLFRQLPGPGNALGSVKFPLQNPWSIYLHDTANRDLFGQGQRHLSHGCVRLEKPLELAEYLLKDQKGWSLEELKAVTDISDGDGERAWDRNVTLKKPMPVYFIYLTAEKSKSGGMRFIEDVYGQDMRVGKAIQNKKIGNELF